MVDKFKYNKGNLTMAYDFDGQCRRIDLYLRADFPYLKTIIYKVSQHEYQIYIGDIDNFNYTLSWITIYSR